MKRSFAAVFGVYLSGIRDALGVQGSPPRIMPNSALIFDVELVSIK